MKYYLCILCSVEPEHTGKRFTMKVATSNGIPRNSAELIWGPPVIGTVTAYCSENAMQLGRGWAQAFSTVMCQQIEQAMRRGSFPSLDLTIPDALVRQAMWSRMPDPIGEIPEGMVVYAFGI